MIRKLLILFALLGVLAVMKPEVEVQADNCTNCMSNYASCQWPAANDYWDCYGVIGDWGDICINGWNNAGGACDNTYTNCIAQNCGYGSYSGPSVACDGDTLMGYSEVGVNSYAGFMSQCAEMGADAFSGANLDPSGFNNCMANSGPEPDQNYCCRAQISLYIELYCRCNFDPRNSDCKKCYVF